MVGRAATSRQERALRLSLADAGLPDPARAETPRSGRRRLARLLRDLADRLDPGGARTSPLETRTALAELFAAVGAVADRHEFTPLHAPHRRRLKP